MTTSAEQTNASVRGQFGAVAAAYATSAVHSSGPDLRALVEAAALNGTEQVLDMGCGAGHTALAVAPLAASVVAVDLTPQMLGVAEALATERGVANITFRLADVSALPFEDASFDVVTCRFSAHHYAKPAKAVQETARVLRPGGRFLLVDTIAPEDPALDTFYQATELLRDISHVRNWRASEWNAMLAAANLRAETLFEMMLDLDGASWVARMQTPPEQVAAIHTLFAAAPPAAKEFFRLKLGDGWGWSIPVALVLGTKPT
jgi:ubiquinone/menaquinone biosynthesis C-methylase UbiE